MQCKRKHKPFSFIFCLIVLFSLTACHVKQYTLKVPQINFEQIQGKDMGFGPVYKVPISLSNFKKEIRKDKIIYTMTWLHCQPECRYMFRFFGNVGHMAFKDSVYVMEENGFVKGRTAYSIASFSTAATRSPNRILKIKIVCSNKTQFTLDTCSIVILLPNASFLNRP